MAPTTSYRAVSLDLWFTTVLHTADDNARWEADRRAFLRRHLVRPDGSHPDERQVDAAVETEGRARREAGIGSTTTDPARLIAAYAERLGARCDGEREPIAEAYSALSFDERPPPINPEVPDVVARLRARGIRLLSITNTARRATTWADYLNGRCGIGFETIVTSCEEGVAKPDPRLFRAAARRVGLAPEEILHVGDRWELDVEGACAAGCGAVLYRGLWDRYPPGLYPGPPPPEGARPEVPRVDRLASVVALAAGGPG